MIRPSKSLLSVISLLCYIIVLSACSNGESRLNAKTINPLPASGNEIARGVSRTSGVAPLSVLFTAGFSSSTDSNREFDELEYSWDFDDSSASEWATSGQSKNKAKGPVASYVFEIAGTYNVSLTVRDASGVIDTDTFTITVLDPDKYFSGSNTTCISDTHNKNFSGCPAGSKHVTTDDVSQMANYAGSNRRILLHRGSSWSRSGGMYFASNTTTLHIGAYGTCQAPSAQGICSNAPQINMTGSSEFLAVDRSLDLRITDINFTGEASNYGIISGAMDIQRMLIMRIQSTGFNDAIIWSHWRESESHRIVENSIVSSHISESERYASFIGGEQLTYMGNIVINSRTSHITRVWNSYLGVISHNILSGASYTNSLGLHALKFHGPTEGQVGTFAETGNYGRPHRSKFTIISNNVFGASGPWPVSIGPENATSNQNLSDILIEKNKFLANYGTQSTRPVITGLMFGGRYFTVRNNVFDGSGNDEGYRGIVIERTGIEATPHGNRLYNNTIFETGKTRWTYEGIVIDRTASDTVVKNNLVRFQVNKKQVLISDYSGKAVKSNNRLDDINGFVDPENNNPLLRNFSLKKSSPAITHGTSVPVFDDIRGARRTNKFSLGAFQHIKD